MTDIEAKIFITTCYKMIVRIIKQRFNEDLSSYQLRFAEKKNNCFASCGCIEQVITFYILGSEVDDDKNFILEAIIHELTHAICFRYGVTSPFFGGEHDLTFAFTCYSLQKKILGKNSNFFREYDIHEELGFKNLKVDEVMLTNIIKKNKFSTVKELLKKTFGYAEYVRKKILKTETFEEWNGYPFCEN